jgi:hypothetical protein
MNNEFAMDRVCQKIFEQELESWDRVQESWPADRAFAVFQQWFDFQIHSMIFDLAEKPIALEEM